MEQGTQHESGYSDELDFETKGQGGGGEAAACTGCFPPAAQWAAGMTDKRVIYDDQSHAQQCAVDRAHLQHGTFAAWHICSVAHLQHGSMAAWHAGRQAGSMLFPRRRVHTDGGRGDIRRCRRMTPAWSTPAWHTQALKHTQHAPTHMRRAQHNASPHARAHLLLLLLQVCGCPGPWTAASCGPPPSGLS